jgi:hypothetical protein
MGVPAGEGGKEAQRRVRGDCWNVISASQTTSCRQLCDDWRLEDAEPVFVKQDPWSEVGGRSRESGVDDDGIWI